MKKSIAFLINLTIIFCKVSAKLYPAYERATSSDLSLPNEWSSVRDCPVRYYEQGHSGIVAPVAGQDAYEREFAHMAAIGWTDENGQIEWNCGGSLISENYILTAGHCLSFKGKAPDVARMGDLNLQSDADDKYAQQISIEKVIPHPLYKARFRYNDIALLKLSEPIKKNADKIMTCSDTDNIFQIQQLTFHPNFVSSGVDNDVSLIELKNEVTFSDDVRPACFYSRDEIPDHVELGLLGLGYRQSLSIFSSFANNENPSKELVISRSSPINNTFCSKFYELDGIQLNEERQVCYGNIDYYLIPDACHIALGAPLIREFWTTDRYHSFIVGLPMHGNDCGFGFPVIATKISHYIDWIDSVIFKNTPQNSCILPNGVKSTCQRASACPHLVQQIKEGKSKLMDYICRFDDNRDPLVCCPDIKTTNQKYDFASCPQKNLQLRRRWNENKELNQLDDEYAHLALIGYEATQEWHCRGNLITDKHVLSSSECVNSDSNYDAVALGNVEKILFRIQKTMTNENFLSLITLDSSVSFSKNIIPICIWLDKDRIPFTRNSIVSKVNEPLFAESVRPHPSLECQGYSNSIKTVEKSCISFFRESICTSPGTGIQAMKNESGIIVPYLVGQLYDVNKINCPNDDDDELKTPDVARMGDLNLQSDADDKYAQQISIEKVIPHPLYKARFRYNDIALLKLSEPIK
uniref:CSON008418 protein n=1 Tax=Culicoides sonorensis TaxID=179676 RepID=A0A336N162_CULSO